MDGGKERGTSGVGVNLFLYISFSSSFFLHCQENISIWMNMCNIKKCQRPNGNSLNRPTATLDYKASTSVLHACSPEKKIIRFQAELWLSLRFVQLDSICTQGAELCGWVCEFVHASVGAAGLLIWIIMQCSLAFHNQLGELWFSAAHDTSGCWQSLRGGCVWLRERERETQREKERERERETPHSAVPAHTNGEGARKKQLWPAVLVTYLFTELFFW